ncbi:hypothetical protein ACP4OV_003392 [Aristida adscensionis]
MASPRRVPTAGGGAGGSDSPSLMDMGNKENISEDGGTLLDCPVVRQELASSAKRKKKPAGFNLRKSIAWNPAFFTEDGILDNSELSVLTGSQLVANGSPASRVSGIMSTPCRSGRYSKTYLRKEVADNSCAKLPAKYGSTGRKLFSSIKTPLRDEWKESVGAQSRSSARSIKKCIPRVSSGSAYPCEVFGRVGHALKKVQNSTSTAQMTRTPNKPQLSLPTVPRCTPSVTAVSKSNKKLAPVKGKQVQRVPGLPRTSKTNSISSGISIENDVVPAGVAICDGANGSAKCKTIQPHPQSSPSSSFRGTLPTCAKPSALRAPSPSLGFFSQEKARISHVDAAKRNVDRCFAGNTSAAKPPRYKQPDNLRSGLHLTKPLAINQATASNLVLPVTRESKTNILVGPENEPLSKLIAKYSAKSGNANNQERPEVDCLLVGSGTTAQPFSSETNDGARNTMSIVCNDASHVEGSGIIKEIEAIENSYSVKASCFSTIEPVEESCSLKEPLSKLIAKYSAKSVNANNQGRPEVDCLLVGSGTTAQPFSSETNDGTRNTMSIVCNDASHVEGSRIIKEIEAIENSYSVKASCFSTIEPVEESCSLKATCSSSRPIVGCKLSPYCESKPGSVLGTAISLENSCVAETSLTVSWSEDNSCTPGVEFLRDSDSCHHRYNESSTLMESVESKTRGHQVPRCDSSSDETLALTDTNSDPNDPLCNEAKPASSSEENTDSGMDFETNNASLVKETLLIHVECEDSHNYRTMESSMKLEAPRTDVERQDALPVKHKEDKMVLDTNKLSTLEGASLIEKNKALDRPRTNTILRDQLKNLVPFTEEWIAAMEACGQEVFEQKTGAVQNSPPDKTAPEPSPWSPVKRKAQDVGPFDCTKYSKIV